LTLFFALIDFRVGERSGAVLEEEMEVLVPEDPLIFF
jgi:hypothetical protein